MKELEITALFALDYTLAKTFLTRFCYPWEALGEIGEFLTALGAALPEGYEQKAEGICVHRTARIHPSAQIAAPCIIDEGAELRPGAFLRGNVLVGKHTIIGNSCEVKNAILFDDVQVPHFNYVGDSILGHLSHMGAGAVTSNVKGDRQPVSIHTPAGDLATGRKKVGAFLGDGAEIGCNSVLNPGTVIGQGARVYPLSCVRGTVPAGCIYKNEDTIVPIQK